jgi:ParB-like chromosome segregation protein Spo0J
MTLVQEDAMARPRQGGKRPRVVAIPTAGVRLEAPGHLADWPRRAEVVPGFAGRVAHVRATGVWPGEPLHVRQQGDTYILLTGFARLAVAVEAGLPTVQAVVEPPAQALPLAAIHLRPWQENAHLNPQKLARRREQACKSGTLPALTVRPARMEEPEGYTLVDGLYWYRVAEELGMAEVPAVVLQGDGE